MNTGVMNIRVCFYLSFFSLTCVASAFADITNCQGVWTNRGCEGVAEERFDEKTYVPPTVEEQERRQKNSLFSNFDLQRMKAERELGVVLSAAEASSACNEGTLKECQDAVGVAERHLNEQVVQASALKEKVKSETKQVDQQPEQAPNVTIIDNRPIVVRPRRHPYRHEHVESGTSLSGSMSLGGGGATVHGSFETKQKEIGHPGFPSKKDGKCSGEKKDPK